MTRHTPKEGQQTLDAILTRSPPTISTERPAKRRRSSRGTSIDVDTYRDDEGAVSTRGKKQINRHLLKTLGRDENPITNSDLYDRTDHIVTCATDVRQNIARSGVKYYQSEKEYFAERHRKLGDQFRAKRTDEVNEEEALQVKTPTTSEDVKQIFAGSTFWINGYTGPRTSAMELQRRIITHGGKIRFVCPFPGFMLRRSLGLMCVGQKSLIDSRDVTHIVVHKELPARKAAQIGKSGMKGIKKVVQVDWVLDCIARATKRGEETCTTTRQQAQASLDGVSPPLKAGQGSSVSSCVRRASDERLPGVVKEKREVEVVYIDDDD